MGDTDEIEFEARAGQSVLFDLAGNSIGSKIKALLTLFDEHGALLASDNGFDGGDPLMNFKVPATGRYRLRISDEMAAGSHEHFYRLSMGSFAEVVGCYPLSIAANKESDVELVGFNLPSKDPGPRQGRRCRRGGCAGGFGKVSQSAGVESAGRRRAGIGGIGTQ